MKLATRSKALIAAAFCAAILLVAVACGEKAEQEGKGGAQEFTLALDFSPNPDHVGIYQALDAGYFEDAGLKVEPKVPPASDLSAPMKQIAAGRVDLAISYEPEVLLARERGFDVVAVGAIASRPLTSLISLKKERIEDPRDLKGKRVATAGIPYQTAYLEFILREAGLSLKDVKQTDVGANLQGPLIAGKVDATLGAFWNVEGVDLEQRKREPRVVPVNELGIPTYDELVLVANGERLKENPEPIRAFIAALSRGTRDAIEDPQRATIALLDAERELDPKLTAAQVKKTLPVLEPGRKGVPFGFMDRARWQEYANFLLDEGVLEERPVVNDALTTRLLPGEGLKNP